MILFYYIVHYTDILYADFIMAIAAQVSDMADGPFVD